jgi:hypothetical protein
VLIEFRDILGFMDKGNFMHNLTLSICAAMSVIMAVPAQRRQVYMGRIDGKFHGWDGETIYKLRDGHIIQQSSYHNHYHYAYSPGVIIYQSGGLKIHVVDDSDEDVSITILR